MHFVPQLQQKALDTLQGFDHFHFVAYGFGVVSKHFFGAL
jgi:hypothetical protein